MTRTYPPVFQLPCALAPNFSNLVVGRFFGGLFSAGGSVTLGTS
jgi:predicted MFS family arabinose efflux permease